VNPALHALGAGEMPPGAHIGRTSDGKRRYSICPPKGQARRYQFAVLTVPPTIRVEPRFSGIALLRGILNSKSATGSKSAGLFFATYKRK
jgi:hypothetical protein